MPFNYPSWWPVAISRFIPSIPFMRSTYHSGPPNEPDPCEGQLRMWFPFDSIKDTNQRSLSIVTRSPWMPMGKVTSLGSLPDRFFWARRFLQVPVHLSLSGHGVLPWDTFRVISIGLPSSLRCCLPVGYRCPSVQGDRHWASYWVTEWYAGGTGRP